MERSDTPHSFLTAWKAQLAAERFCAYFRFVIALITLLTLLYLTLFHFKSFLLSFLEIFFIIIICVYSGIFVLFEPKPTQFLYYLSKSASFLDITIISCLVFLFLLSGLPFLWIQYAVFPFYLIGILLSSFYTQQKHTISVGIYTGIIYSSIFIFSNQAHHHVTAISQLFSSLFFIGVSTFLSVASARFFFLKIQQQEESTRTLSVLQKFFPVILVSTNKDGLILNANVQNPAHFGIASEKMVGKSITEFVEGVRNNFEANTIQGTFKSSRFKSEVKYVECLLQQTSSGGLEGCVVDVTERETALFQRHEMEQRLFQFQKMESLGTLASGMAHDFKNILQTISDICATVKTQSFEMKTLQYMDEINLTLTDARFLISELFALGRKKPLNYISMNISSFVTNLIPQFSLQLGEKYKVSLTIANDNLWIQGDAEYLKRVLHNLFVNARDAMPNGGMISIEVFPMKKDLNDQYIIVRFADSGIGISEEIIDKVFDPFFTTKSTDKGTGLGLALIKRIMNLHRGSIFIEKTDYRGTTFRLEFPASSKDTEDIDTTVVLINRLNSRIILLDDDQRTRRITNVFLSELGYGVDEAETMEEGLLIMQRNKDQCHILIMDWRMRDVDPHLIIQNFRKVKPELIIMVISGFQPIQQSIKQYNIFRWITKPFDRNRLDLEIQKALYLKNLHQPTTVKAS